MRINFSGHPVNGVEINPLVGVNLDTTSAEALEEQLRITIRSLEDFESLAQGAMATIILPGFAPAAAILLGIWNGAFGSFPEICWPVRGPKGFEWPEATRSDLSELRLSSRNLRVQQP
jgi:hypothetical protein